jgi:ABC-type antimicrobial peptide transport system permease subunit
VSASFRASIGIRIALGADRSNVIAQVMKQGLTLTIIGEIIGLAAGFGLNRLMESLLFGVARPFNHLRVGARPAGRGQQSKLFLSGFHCWLRQEDFGTETTVARAA